MIVSRQKVLLVFLAETNQMSVDPSRKEENLRQEEKVIYFHFHEVFKEKNCTSHSRNRQDYEGLEI